MTHEQINAIYQYMVAGSNNPEQLEENLQRPPNDFDTIHEAALFLPMYSMGIAAARMQPRINFLIENNWTVDMLAACTENDMTEIANSHYQPGHPFGYRNRVAQLRRRATEILAHDQQEFEATLDSADRADNVEAAQNAFEFLKDFHYVGDMAAFHIIMDLGWFVVKPDLHIKRFLYRLGGHWRNIVNYNPARKEPYYIQAYQFWPFQYAWRDAVVPITNEIGFSSRQVDRLIMWYTQNWNEQRDGGWRPGPICINNPACRNCEVPDCAAHLPQ